MAVPPMTLARRATDHGEPTNREILDRLDAFIAEHRRDHALLESRLQGNADTLASRLSAVDVAAAIRQERLARLETLAPDVAQLHDFKVQVQTIGSSVKWIFGGSLIAALASIMALVATFGHIIQSGQ